jgi:hypothetical protein
MVEENHPQPHAAEQIEPEVTLDDKRERRSILISHDARPIGSLAVASGSVLGSLFPVTVQMSRHRNNGLDVN